MPLLVADVVVTIPVNRPLALTRLGQGTPFRDGPCPLFCLRCGRDPRVGGVPGPHPFFWLSATDPRMSAQAMPMRQVTGSPSRLQAQATPATGTR